MGNQEYWWLAEGLFSFGVIVLVVWLIRRPYRVVRANPSLLDDASAFPVNDAELYRQEDLDGESLVEVFTAFNDWEAEQAAEILSSNGIRCHKSNTALQNAVGDLPYYAIAPRLLVLERDSIRSRELLERVNRENSGPVTGPVWHCLACGNENDPGFGVCWSCQAAKDESRSSLA